MDNTFQIRVTGILIEDNKILLVKQKYKDREWSLPGGRLENGESIENGLIREMFEETGLNVQIEYMLYTCDVPDTNYNLIHITFLLSKKSGDIILPTNEFDSNPISDVKFVELNDLVAYGFSERFMQLAFQEFPNKGNYFSSKSHIGL